MKWINVKNKLPKFFTFHDCNGGSCVFTDRVLLSHANPEFFNPCCGYAQKIKEKVYWFSDRLNKLNVIGWAKLPKKMESK